MVLSRKMLAHKPDHIPAHEQSHMREQGSNRRKLTKERPHSTTRQSRRSMLCQCPFIQFPASLAEDLVLRVGFSLRGEEGSREEGEGLGGKGVGVVDEEDKETSEPHAAPVVGLPFDGEAGEVGCGGAMR